MAGVLLCPSDQRRRQCCRAAAGCKKNCNGNKDGQLSNHIFFSSAKGGSKDSTPLQDLISTRHGLAFCQRPFDILDAVLCRMAVEIEGPVATAAGPAEPRIRRLSQGSQQIRLHAPMPLQNFPWRTPVIACIDQVIAVGDIEAAHFRRPALATRRKSHTFLPIGDVRERVLHSPWLFGLGPGHGLPPFRGCQPGHQSIQQPKLADGTRDNFLARVSHGSSSGLAASCFPVALLLKPYQGRLSPSRGCARKSRAWCCCLSAGGFILLPARLLTHIHLYGKAKAVWVYTARPTAFRPHLSWATIDALICGPTCWDSPRAPPQRSGGGTYDQAYPGSITAGYILSLNCFKLLKLTVCVTRSWTECEFALGAGFRLHVEKA